MRLKAQDKSLSLVESKFSGRAGTHIVITRMAGGDSHHLTRSVNSSSSISVSSRCHNPGSVGQEQLGTRYC